jgi:HTH-type transcriptional repressor of NAD biosynthesis genes
MIGLTLGKFMPFHLGHIKLIEFALEQVDQLIILVVSKDNEDIPKEVRLNWLETYYCGDSRVRIISFHHNLPHDGVFTDEKINQWCHAIGAVVPKVDRVYTSETYGIYLASYLGADYRLFDQDRIQVHISGTQIRKEPMRYFEFLPKSVQAYYLREQK